MFLNWMHVFILLCFISGQLYFKINETVFVTSASLPFLAHKSWSWFRDLCHSLVQLVYAFSSSLFPPHTIQVLEVHTTSTGQNLMYCWAQEPDTSPKIFLLICFVPYWAYSYSWVECPCLCWTIKLMLLGSGVRSPRALLNLCPVSWILNWHIG